MNKPNIKDLARKAQGKIVHHSPEILIGVGIAGMVTSTILAVKATPKALQLIEEAKTEKQDELTKIEVVKATWKCYIPATVTGVVAAGCLIGGNKVNLRRNAALATAYKLSETAFTEYREKVVETIGEKKEKAVKEKIMKDHIDKNPINKSSVIITGKGDVACRDSIGGREFTTSVDSIKKAEIAINRKLVSGANSYVSLNEFYYELGLDGTESGEKLGWNVDDGYVEIEFNTFFDENLSEPVIVLYYSVAPKLDYYKYY